MPAVFFLRFVPNKHGYIRFDGVPNHITDLQRDTVGIVRTDDLPIVLNTDIQGTAFCIGKGDDFFADIADHLRFEFHSLTFDIVHKAPPALLIIIIVIVIILVNF